MQGEYDIRLKDGAVPFALTTPRRVAIPLMESVKAELTRMEKLGYILHRGTHGLVRGNGRGAKAQQACLNLC